MLRFHIKRWNLSSWKLPLHSDACLMYRQESSSFSTTDKCDWSISTRQTGSSGQRFEFCLPPFFLQTLSFFSCQNDKWKNTDWGECFIWCARLEFQIKMSFLAFPYRLLLEFFFFFCLIRMLKRSFEMGRPFLKPLRESVCREVVDSRTPLHPPTPFPQTECALSRWEQIPDQWPARPCGCLVLQQKPLDNSGSVETKTRVGGGDLVPGHWCPECSIQSPSQLRNSGGNLQPSC